jgi:lysophospholipase L1-like esterase
LIYSRPVAVLLMSVLLLSSLVSRQTELGAQESITYIAMGDSVAFGVGSSLPEKRGYPALVRGLLVGFTSSDVSLSNLAIPGETAETFLQDGQLESFIENVVALLEQRRTVDYITISLGGNEMLVAAVLEFS